MDNGQTVFDGKNISVYFQSQRAGLDADLTGKLVAFIKDTRKTLDCAIYDLRDPDILDALQSVANDPKRALRIAYDAGKKDRTHSAMADPKPSGTQVAIEKEGLAPAATAIHDGRYLMHDKFLVRDGETVWTGSANFTVGGLQEQDNNCLIIESTELADTYTNDFEELFQKEHDHHHRNQPAQPSQEIRVNDNTTITPLFSPESVEGIEDAIIAKLKGARKVRILAFLISDQGILGALAELQDSDIKGVYDPHGMANVGKNGKNPELFWFEHDRRFVKAPSHAFNPDKEQDFMHNKVMIIDDRYVITGSYNFSESAESNDENLLIIDSPEVAKKYTSYFDTLFEQYAQ